MKTILAKQLELQQKLQANLNNNLVGSLCGNIKDTNFFLNQEIIELIEEIAGSRDILKPWKSNYRSIHCRRVVLTDKVKEEAIDVLCFAMNICLMAGITPDNIEDEYNKVYKKNIDRLIDGY